jgi:hypothetical protein
MVGRDGDMVTLTAGMLIIIWVDCDWHHDFKPHAPRRRDPAPPSSCSKKDSTSLDTAHNHHFVAIIGTTHRPGYQSLHASGKGILGFFPSIVLIHVLQKLIRDVGITHGDEKKVGYYVGVLVRRISFDSAVHS